MSDKSVIKGRNSAIELLKVIAVLGIICSHSVMLPARNLGYVQFINLKMATSDIKFFISALFLCLGQWGNTVFIVCSAWFLLDSKKVKWKKAINMIMDTFVISSIICIGGVLAGVSLPLTTIIEQFFPVIFGQYWFISCYIIFYIIHPLLNIIISALDKRKMLCVALLSIIYLSINALHNFTGLYYNTLIGFICIYFIIAYMKNYLKRISDSVKVNAVVCIACTVLFITLMIITNILGLHIGRFSDKLLLWNDFYDPLIFFQAISLFNIVRNYHFVDKKVNYLSSCSMIVYVINSGIVIEAGLKPMYYNYIYEKTAYDYLIISELVFFLVLAVGSFLLAIVYRAVLQKAVRKAVDMIYGAVSILYNKFINLIIKWE